MLVIIYGPSCVGKTSIISSCANRFGWKPIMCYTTRKSRSYDLARTHLSVDEFNRRNRNGELMLVNENFGNFYANSKDEIQKAILSREVFILDLLIKDRDKIKSEEIIEMLIVPVTRKELEKRVRLTSRYERLDDILLDYDTNFASTKIKKYRDDGCFIIENADSKLFETVDHIHKIISHASSI